MKAFLINPIQEKIIEVDTDGSLEDIYKLLEVNLIDSVRYDSDNIIYVDDEGLLKPIKEGFFVIGNSSLPLAGKGLVIGLADSGKEISSNLTLGELEERILLLPNAAIFKYFALRRK